MEHLSPGAQGQEQKSKGPHKSVGAESLPAQHVQRHVNYNSLNFKKVMMGFTHCMTISLFTPVCSVESRLATTSQQLFEP